MIPEELSCDKKCEDCIYSCDFEYNKENGYCERRKEKC